MNCPICENQMISDRRNKCSHQKGSVICPALAAHYKNQETPIAACQTCAIEQNAIKDKIDQIIAELERQRTA